MELTGAGQNGEATNHDVDREIGKKLEDYKIGEEVNCFVKSVWDTIVKLEGPLCDYYDYDYDDYY